MPKQDTILEQFDNRFPGTCFTNFGPESDCGYDIKQFITEAIQQTKEQMAQDIRTEIASYAGIDDIQTKDLIKIIIDYCNKNNINIGGKNERP